MRYLFIKERQALFKQCGKCARQYRCVETMKEKKKREGKETHLETARARAVSRGTLACTSLFNRKCLALFRRNATPHRNPLHESILHRRFGYSTLSKMASPCLAEHHLRVPLKTKRETRRKEKQKGQREGWKGKRGGREGEERGGMLKGPVFNGRRALRALRQTHRASSLPFNACLFVSGEV